MIIRRGVAWRTEKETVRSKSRCFGSAPQESARARERKKAERTRLERTVAKRTEDCDRLRATLRALQAESGALRQALLEGTMFTLSQVPTMEPPAAKQAFATAQLCAHALQSPVLFAAMDPLDQSNKVWPRCVGGSLLPCTARVMSC
jgi:hypothetical protein